MRKYEFFVTENPQEDNAYMIYVFPEDVKARDYDSIGCHSPDIAEVLNPIGIFAEDMECCFSYYPKGNRYIRQPYTKGLSIDGVTEYLVSCGWAENKGFDF